MAEVLKPGAGNQPGNLEQQTFTESGALASGNLSGERATPAQPLHTPDRRMHQAYGSLPRQDRRGTVPTLSPRNSSRVTAVPTTVDRKEFVAPVMRATDITDETTITIAPVEADTQADSRTTHRKAASYGPPRRGKEETRAVNTSGSIGESATVSPARPFPIKEQYSDSRTTEPPKGSDVPLVDLTAYEPSRREVALRAAAAGISLTAAGKILLHGFRPPQGSLENVAANLAAASVDVEQKILAPGTEPLISPDKIFPDRNGMFMVYGEHVTDPHETDAIRKASKNGDLTASLWPTGSTDIANDYLKQAGASGDKIAITCLDSDHENTGVTTTAWAIPVDLQQKSLYPPHLLYISAEVPTNFNIGPYPESGTPSQTTVPQGREYDPLVQKELLLHPKLGTPNLSAYYPNMEHDPFAEKQLMLLQTTVMTRLNYLAKYAKGEVSQEVKSLLIEDVAASALAILGIAAVSSRTQSRRDFLRFTGVSVAAVTATELLKRANIIQWLIGNTASPEEQRILVEAQSMIEPDTFGSAFLNSWTKWRTVLAYQVVLETKDQLPQLAELLALNVPAKEAENQPAVLLWGNAHDTIAQELPKGTYREFEIKAWVRNVMRYVDQQIAKNYTALIPYRSQILQNVMGSFTQFGLGELSYPWGSNSHVTRAQAQAIDLNLQGPQVGYMPPTLTRWVNEVGSEFGVKPLQLDNNLPTKNTKNATTYVSALEH